MKKISRDDKEKTLKYLQWIFWGILLTGAVVRLFGLGYFPGKGGLNQDEAYTIYDAWCLANYGMDSREYSMPVYTYAWGKYGGQSVFQLYAILPLIKLFGAGNYFWARLPQALLGIFSLPVIYGIGKRLHDEKYGLILMAALAICPWHIMQSRWALDCNYFPGLLLIAVYFAIYAQEKRSMVLLFSLFFGFSLYVYASPWIIMPFLFAACLLLSSIREKKLIMDIYFWVAILIVVIMAIPLLLYVMVNADIISEIKTPFFSVPKGSVFRANELSFHIKDLCRSFKILLKLLFRQSDGLLWNAAPHYGLYYKFSLVFGIPGMIYSLWVLKQRGKNISMEWIMWIWFILAVLRGCLSEVNVNQINIIHIPIVYFIARGCDVSVGRNRPFRVGKKQPISAG